MYYFCGMSVLQEIDFVCMEGVMRVQEWHSSLEWSYSQHVFAIVSKEMKENKLKAASDTSVAYSKALPTNSDQILPFVIIYVMSMSTEMSSSVKMSLMDVFLERKARSSNVCTFARKPHIVHAYCDYLYVFIFNCPCIICCHL